MVEPFLSRSTVRSFSILLPKVYSSVMVAPVMVLMALDFSVHLVP